MPLNTGTLPRLTPSQLHALLKPPSISTSGPSTSSNSSGTTSEATSTGTPAPSVTVIDVRDSDYMGGHVRGGIHAPSHTLDTALPELARTLAATDVVVFHCMLSQERGPRAALRYARERRRLLGPAAGGVYGDDEEDDSTTQIDSSNQSASATSGESSTRAGSATQTSSTTQRPKKQKVAVLQGGFEAWQAAYGEDESVTEGFRREVWRDSEDSE